MSPRGLGVIESCRSRGGPQPGHAVKRGLRLLLLLLLLRERTGKRSRRIETRRQPGLACFSTTKTLLNCPQKAARAGERGVSRRGRRSPGRVAHPGPPSRSLSRIPPCHPCPLLSQGQPPRDTPGLRGAESDALSHLCVSQTERLQQRWDVLMIGWHKAVLISLRNGNEG